jgi:hypothetical protein
MTTVYKMNAKVKVIESQPLFIELDRPITESMSSIFSKFLTVCFVSQTNISLKDRKVL